MSIRDVLFFDAMLTPKVVTLVYWLLLVTAVIAGLGLHVLHGLPVHDLRHVRAGPGHHHRRRHRCAHLVRARHRAVQAERERPAHRQFQVAAHAGAPSHESHLLHFALRIVTLTLALALGACGSKGQGPWRRRCARRRASQERAAPQRQRHRGRSRRGDARRRGLPGPRRNEGARLEGASRRRARRAARPDVRGSREPRVVQPRSDGRAGGRPRFPDQDVRRDLATGFQRASRAAARREDLEADHAGDAGLHISVAAAIASTKT